MKKLLRKVGVFAAICGLIYLYFALLLNFTCKNILCFKEGVSAFICESSILQNMISEPGGLSEICTRWLTQWFAKPMAAVFVGAILYSLIAVLTTVIARRLGIRLSQLPLLVMPATALALMSCNIDYNLAGTMAFMLMLAAILPLAYIKNATVRLVVATAGCGLVAWIGAPIVMLYAIVVLNIELLRCDRKGCFFAVLPLIALFLGWIGINMGYYRDFAHALLPYAFYTHWAAPGSMALLPWIVAIAVINAAAALRLLRMPKGALYQGAIATVSLAALLWIFAAPMRSDEPDSFARLSYLSGGKEWSQIALEYKQMPQDNITLQNIVNMALAENDMLCDVLFHHPNSGVASLHNSDDKNPYTYMALSDVYYSMGLVALAQKLAFEANEALGNSSPRMLMRLTDTNIVTGQTELALKYIYLLEHTRRYSTWAKERRMMIEGNLPLDAELASKRACVFPDNRFAGIHGFDDDMLQVLRANPQHRPTMQYLCAYYMLGRNIPKVISVIEEFSGSLALRIPLPEHLQEAVVIDAIVNGSGIDTRYQIHPSVMQRCKAFWADHQPQPSTLWHYLRHGSGISDN